jgi:hypothetical protein
LRKGSHHSALRDAASTIGFQHDLQQVHHIIIIDSSRPLPDALSDDPLGAGTLVRCQSLNPRQTFYFLDLTWLQIGLKFVFVFVSGNNDYQFPNHAGFNNGASIFYVYIFIPRAQIYTVTFDLKSDEFSALLIDASGLQPIAQ